MEGGGRSWMISLTQTTNQSIDEEFEELDLDLPEISLLPRLGTYTKLAWNILAGGFAYYILIFRGRVQGGRGTQSK